MERSGSIALLFVTILSIQGVLLETGALQFSSPVLRRQYRFAIQDAAIAESGKITNSLVQVMPNNTWLVCNTEKTQVLIATWKRQSSYEQFIKPFINASKNENQLIWVTAAPQVKGFCQRYLQDYPNTPANELKLRFKQYLGLAPDWQYDVFVELWGIMTGGIRPSLLELVSLF